MIIKAKTIITNDKANNFYEDAAILIEENIIKGIGDFDKIKGENPLRTKCYRRFPIYYGRCCDRSWNQSKPLL